MRSTRRKRPPVGRSDDPFVSFFGGLARAAYDKKDKLNEWSTKEGVYIASDKPQASTKHAPPAATPAAPPKSEAKNATGAQQPAK